MIKRLLLARAERNRQQAALIVARISRSIEIAQLVRRAKEKSHV